MMTDEAMNDDGTTRSHTRQDEQTQMCGKQGAPCCQGEWKPPGVFKDQRSGRTLCLACLPYFFALGPEKTGTTDLYVAIHIRSHGGRSFMISSQQPNLPSSH